MADSMVKDKEENAKEEEQEEEREGEGMQGVEEAFDPALCAKLYNRLIRIGFHGRNRAQNGESLRTNWFKVWQTDPKVLKYRERFPRPLVEFLEQIEIVVGSDGSTPYRDALTYHLQSIPSPRGFDDNFGLDTMRDDGINCIYLFHSNLATIPHRMGLIIDLNDFSVRYTPNLFSHIGRDEEGWYTLQDILLNLNFMFEIGKYIPAPRGTEQYDVIEPGWMIVPWNNLILDETLAAWEGLVDAIATRLPDQTFKQDTRPQRKQLSSKDKIPSSIRGFTREFLLRASKPPFKYIAPGLTVYDSHTPPLSIPTKRENDFIQYATPYKEIRDEVFHDPIILFPFEESTREELSGLWILPERSWADSICLVLPYKVKNFPDVRYGQKESHTALFQSPMCPFYADHGTSLTTLLIVWKSLIEEGIWMVGTDGIEGGKEFYRQAEDKEKQDWFRVGECFDFPSYVEINIDD